MGLTTIDEGDIWKVCCFWEVCHSGIGKSEHFCFPFITIVNIKISITYRTHHPTNYTPYQEYLYKRVKGYKEDFVSPIGYRKITKLFNSEGLKSPTNKTFYPSLIQSIYKKGKRREKRLSSEVRVEKSMEVKQIGNDKVRYYLKWKTQLHLVFQFPIKFLPTQPYL